MKITPRALALALAGSTAAFGQAASATTFFEEDFVCPIGGEEFKASVVGSNSSFGQRPDGKPFSPLPVYPIVECPENGFLLFAEDFTEDELAILANAIATPEFKAMRTNDTPHYRAWWLKEKVGRNLVSQLSSLLQASWETDHDQARKRQYQAQFASLAVAMKRDEENAANWLFFNLRAVNAMRELGNFAEGLAQLDLATQPENLPATEEEKEDALSYAAELRALLSEENPFFEPTNLVPTRVAMFRCADPVLPLTRVEITVCEGEEVSQVTAGYTHTTNDGQEFKGKDAVRAASREWRSRGAGHSH